MESNWDWGTFRSASTRGKWANDRHALEKCNGFICPNTFGRNISNPDWLRANITRMASITDGTSNTFAVGESVPAWTIFAAWFCNNQNCATTAIPLNYRKGVVDLAAHKNDFAHNFGFFSQHPGGANFAMADASVRFISDTIDLELYRALATVSGGEAVQLP